MITLMITLLFSYTQVCLTSNNKKDDVVNPCCYYPGFIKLIEQQRDLLVARDLVVVRLQQLP